MRGPRFLSPIARSLRHRRARGERGAAMVEFALVLPMLLILVFGIVDFGRAFQSWVTVTNAAREGARLGTVGGTVSAICSRVTDTAGVSGASCAVTYPGGNITGQSVAVKVSYNFAMITPLGTLVSQFFGGSIPNTIPISTTADMRIE